MPIGCNQPLYILPFDHRASFQKTFGWQGALTAAQTAEIIAAKLIIYPTRIRWETNLAKRGQRPE